MVFASCHCLLFYSQKTPPPPFSTESPKFSCRLFCLRRSAKASLWFFVFLHGWLLCYGFQTRTIGLGMGCGKSSPIFFRVELQFTLVLLGQLAKDIQSTCVSCAAWTRLHAQAAFTYYGRIKLQFQSTNDIPCSFKIWSSLLWHICWYKIILTDVYLKLNSASADWRSVIQQSWKQL